MSPGRAAVATLVACALLAGCSRQESASVPAACREGPDAVRQALRAAPGRVTLDGTPLSECIRDTSDGGSLRDVGEAWLTVAGRLADDAARDPEGRSALQLGYLLGAYARSQAGTQGVGYELGRRMRSELARVNTRSRAFTRGERAGRSGG